MIIIIMMLFLLEGNKVVCTAHSLRTSGSYLNPVQAESLFETVSAERQHFINSSPHSALGKELV